MHSRLSGQVDDTLWAMAIEEVCDCLLVGEVCPHELKARSRFQSCQPGLFQSHVVVIVEIVEPDDLFTTLQQALCEMKADEARSACHEYARHALPFSCNLTTGWPGPFRSDRRIEPTPRERV